MNPTMLAVMHCNPHHRLGEAWHGCLGGVYRDGDIIRSMTRQSRVRMDANMRGFGLGRMVLVSPSVYAWRQLP